VADPCKTSTTCNAYSHTHCVGVYSPAVGSSGPPVAAGTTGPSSSVTCPCDPGFTMGVAAPDQYGFFPCTRTCEYQNGGCDVHSFCRMRGNTPTCKCKPGYSFTFDPNLGPVFEATVSAGQTCDAASCSFPGQTLGPNGLAGGNSGLPEHATIGDCINVLPGAFCRLGCEAGFAPANFDATLTQCVGSNTGSAFQLPSLRRPCIPAPLAPATPERPPHHEPNPPTPPEHGGAPVHVESPYGDAWTCTRVGREPIVCKPVIKSVTRGFSHSGFGSALVHWDPFSKKLHVTKLEVIITSGDQTGVLQTPPNPQNPAADRMHAKTLFQGLQPGGFYSFQILATVEITPGTTTVYSSDPVSIQACSTEC